MTSRLSIISILLITFLASPALCLKEVSDEALLELLKKEFLLVVFSKPNCDKCPQFEALVDAVSKPLAAELQVESVKLTESQLTKLYSPTREPAVVFFRHGIPILLNIDESWTSDELYQKLIEVKDPLVKELSDANFEHLTQASTGATTGDWLVHFYQQKCIECQRLNAVWEGVASELKHKMNTARVNVDNSGLETGKRFGIEKVPKFVLIRQGKFYIYDTPKYDITSFVLFATHGFKNAKAHLVRVPATSFDNLISKFVEYLRAFVEFTSRIKEEQPYFFLTVIGLLLIFVGIIFARKRSNTIAVKGKRHRKAKDKAK